NDARVRQAMDQLRQASEDMRRAASQGQQNPEDARRAADRLREATRLLGGIQNQQAGQRLDSLVREGDRLGEEERAQQERMRQAFGRGGQGQGQNNADLFQEMSRLSIDRQRLSQDLTNLEKQMQDSIRQLANGQ